MSIRRLLVIAFALVGLVLAATPSTADSFRVRATGDGPTNYRWKPSARTIGKGDKVVWKNPTGATHTVTAYDGAWDKNSSVSPDAKTTFRFNRKGHYFYRCTRPGHSTLSDGECSGMCGHVVVQ